MSSGLDLCYIQKEDSFPFEGKQGAGFPVWDLPGKALKGRPAAQEPGMDSVWMLNDLCGNMSYFCPVLRQDHEEYESVSISEPDAVQV